MDPELPIIFTFVVTLALILFAFVTMTHRRVVRHDERKLELKARAAEAAAGKGGGDYAKLEERIRVLERIATDKDHDLAMQIEALRDVQEIDQLTEKREVTPS